MRPVVPVKGDPVLASWAGDVIDYAGSRWRYVPLDGVVGVTSRPYPNNVTLNLELTELPANDPTIVAALVSAMVRETTASSRVLQIHSGQDTTRRVGYVGTSGYPSRGSGGVGFITPVGGVNNRSIAYYGSTSTTATCWVTVLGYFIEESDEPATGTSGPITAPLPTDPAPGDYMLASWAESMLGMVGKAWRYHPIYPEAAGTVRSEAGTWTEAVPDVIPADAVAASCYIRMRPSNTNNISATLYDSDGTSRAGLIYSSGVAMCYTVTGHHPVILDATRQYTLSVSAATNDTLAVFTGYWTKDA